MEFAVVAQGQPVIADILNDLGPVFIRLVLGIRDIILNAFDPLPVRSLLAIHFDLCGIHIGVEHFCLARITQCILNCCGLRLFQCYCLTNVLILKGKHLVRVKTQHVFIADAVGNAVAVQFVAKHIGLCVVFLGIFLENRCAGKAEENCVRESILDVPKHITKG